MGRTHKDFVSGTEPNGIQRTYAILARFRFEHADVAKKGIVGRGILIDYSAYAAAHNISLAIFEQTAVTLPELLKAAEWHGVKRGDFKAGDILFIRLGYTVAYEALDEPERDR